MTAQTLYRRRLSPRSLTATAVLAWTLALASGATAEVVAIVGVNSSIKTLTRSQVADIFLGRSVRLADGARPVPFDQPERAAARAAFYDTFAGKTPAQMKAHWSKIVFTGRGQPPAEVPDGQQALTMVAANPNAIAYIERALADRTVRILPP
jgi:ABC-type phosphate transport system substrate-binding protein